MRIACANGGLPREAAVLLTAHGTGTQLNDANEAAAVRALFDGHSGQLRVIATKSAHGHLLGGSSAIQILIGLMAMRNGLAPPIQNFTQQDLDCELPLVVGQPEAFVSSHLLSNAFGFGGLNIVLLFERPR